MVSNLNYHLSQSFEITNLLPCLLDMFKHEYNVVATDYDDYSVVYSCKTIDDKLTIEMGSILSRSREMSDDVKDLVRADLDKLKIDINKFRPIDQSNCA